MDKRQKLDIKAADQLLHAIPEWAMTEQGTTLARTVALGDFQDAIVFVNLVAKLAEKENHHPDIFVHGYNNVTLSLSTHSVGGLTESDFLMAAKIDTIIDKA